MQAEDAVFAGWDALREAMSSNLEKICPSGSTTRCLFNLGGGHISVHERILQGAVTRVGDVAPCEWAVWDCGQLCVVLLPLSGLHGLIPSR